MDGPINKSETGLLEAGPSHQRAFGTLKIAADFDGSFTRVERLYQSGSVRMLFPNTHGAELAGVIVNTAGGLTGGDQFAASVRVRPRATLSVTSQASERIYRSAAGDAEVRVKLNVESSGELAWIPHQTILFNGGRLRRRIEAHVARNASLWLMESIVFGRLAMGEEICAGQVVEDWQVYREGHLAHAEAFRLDGSELPYRSNASLAGQKCIATLLHIGTGIEAKLQVARSILDADPRLEAGASAWNGRMLLRLAGGDPAAMRRLVVKLLTTLRNAPVPRNLRM
ncbi:MAG: urease accessory protein UreD [Paracoccaceae bacterium]|nr:urease accessory protein UreD [Paracoccaceae bacterium]